MNSPDIRPQRFLADLEAIAQIGLLSSEAGGGRDRRPFSPAHRQARAYFMQAARDAGLSVHVDPAGNVSARLPADRPDAPTLLMGSHLDTVPHGGPYDGALGVVAGLEVLRVLAENDLPRRYALEVVDFTDEEGRFGDFFGSRALSGQLTAEQVRAFLERATAYPQDLEAARAEIPGGLAVDAVLQARRPPESLAGYLELHIEQGPRLERAGVPIGVVTAIFGRRSWLVTFFGRPDHAGTTPMDLRADALVAAAHFVQALPTWVRQFVAEGVATCGNVQVRPGVYNVVPGQVTVWVEARAASLAELDRLEEGVRELARQAAQAEGPVTCQIQATARSEPTPMDPEMREVLHRAAAARGLAALDLPSGAGHDAQMLARITPTGMIFVPSVGGRSHCPEEFTHPEDLVAGARVLLEAVIRLAVTSPMGSR